MKKNNVLSNKENNGDGIQAEISRRRFLAAPIVLPALFANPFAIEQVNAASPTLALRPRYYPLDTFPDEIDLSGKLAVVTGASRGIGRATADALCERGVEVIGTSRDVSSVPNPPTAYDLYNLDITKPRSVRNFAIDLAKNYRGRPIDILINNAGRLAFGSILPAFANQGASSFYFKQIRLATETLYHGPIRVTQALLPLMQSSGYARLFFTVSSSAYITTGVDPLASLLEQYISSKRALLSYANSLRAALFNASSNIIVSTVNPYTINTALPKDRNPIYLQPVNDEGLSDNDELFNLILGLIRQAQAVALPPALVGDTYVQLLTSLAPPANVVVASDSEPFKTQGGNDLVEGTILAENSVSAIPYVAVPA